VIERILDDLKKQKTKMIQLDSDLKNLNFTKMNIRLHLRDIYNKIMKEKEDILLENGLTWIIKSYWFINEGPPIDLFPKILDNGSKDFIMEYSKIDYELMKLTGQLKEKQKELIKAKIKEESSFTNHLISGTHSTFLTEKYGYFQRNIKRTHRESLRSEDGDRLKVLY